MKLYNMLQEQQNLLERLRKLPSDVRKLIEKRIELYVFEFGDKFSVEAARIISNLVTIIILAVALFFLLFAASFFIGDLLGNTAAGFAVVSVLLLVLSLVIYLLSPELIEAKVRTSIARSFINEKNVVSGIENEDLGRDDLHKDDSPVTKESNVKMIEDSVTNGSDEFGSKK